ncbi:trap-type transport system, small permease component [Luminiphilus syltensis NOR5-1B]|uniref:TRAP transporter small permease protein n=1 Tax=Luminiphilus syltensis NOR5-1B TaxID=565045 RepID=B8KUB3_9GAMM|nr:TRAP transporter small permease subunit [Luminiphilus syltensis]EED36572.1 trap-type transport system, small permease component [Luminiphilus syltensis NOR5-1B]
MTRVLESAITALGRAIAWLVPAMALLTFIIVVMRYGFSTGAMAAQEAVLYMHSAVFMLGAAYTLAADEHVRVDILYHRFSPRGRTWVNVIGHVIFTLPICALICFSSLDYVTSSWSIRETSAETGGIPAVFLLKTLIPIMATLLAAQALIEIVRGVTQLCGVHDGRR